MKSLLRVMIGGSGYGAVAYLVALALRIQPNLPTAGNIISVLLMSALIGGLTLIFNSESLAYPLALLIHVSGTLALVTGTMWLNNWGVTWSFLGTFVVAYLLLWGAVRFNQFLRIEKINRVLAQRQAQHK
ncbi:DUF3021 domain-containing protein [Lactiplantibacillus herbarum]|uniref:DUF3021 domain-containing protein n=1 Tax=Lactiplantibacillus herbarum TaxID=1670446 RepID=UPI00064EA04D|nr:DUF3021 domain-containing protein [Lactiplantibacillus herbarum]